MSKLLVIETEGAERMEKGIEMICNALRVTPWCLFYDGKIMKVFNNEFKNNEEELNNFLKEEIKTGCLVLYSKENQNMGNVLKQFGYVGTDKEIGKVGNMKVYHIKLI